MRRPRFAPFVPACLIAATACRAGAPEPAPEPASDTPRATIERLQAAEREGRYGDALAWIHPDERELAVYINWFAVAYDAIGATGDEADDYRALLERQRLDEAWLDADATGPGGPRRVAREALAGRPLEPVFQDVMVLRARYGQFGQAFGLLGEVGSIEVDGARATARIGDGDYTFERVDGVWYWRLFGEEAVSSD